MCVFVSYTAGRWSAWSEWSSCSAECIQIRRRKCITTSSSAVLVDDDDAGLGISVGGLSSNGIVGSLNSGNLGSTGLIPGGIKAQCSGKDIQTAECRGEYCQIGKDGK